MHIHTRNINTAFRTLVGMFSTGEYQSEDGAWGRLAGETAPIVRRPSRNGTVLVIDEPVTITYSHPRERVLFNGVRDANPFFHLYEALWMLAGRNDVAPLSYYNSRIKEFSDDGKTLNGAYGYRWRKSGVQRHDDGRIRTRRIDQLDILVDHLKADPTSRRAVLQMWNVEDDLLKIGLMKRSELRDANNPSYRGEMISGNPGSKDVCCNLSVMFSLRMERQTNPTPHLGEGTCGIAITPKLDMTVTNRSNDLVWGLLGANYVHFSFLQEYMAARLGVEVGKYHHFTNNLHAYVERPDWKPKEWLDEEPDTSGYDMTAPTLCNMVPLVSDPAVFERELPEFVQAYSDPGDMEAPLRTWQEPFLERVAAPMLTAFLTYKRRGATTMAWTQRIKADDWRLAAQGWIERRLDRPKGRTVKEGDWIA